ncbi:hypothetical protein JCM11641_005427 [Rhodosporidiobolus odoratus]
MGVHGLWQLVSPCARPIQLETLGGKRLAIDASIWLYQFQMAMRDRKTGDTLQGAHIMGTFRRIMKLLFHGVKPVFVFDGDAPMLKKRTIEKRRKRKEGAGRDLAKTAQELLAAQLRGVVAEKELNRCDSTPSHSCVTLTSLWLSRRKDVLTRANGDADTGDQIGEDAVYLEDLDQPSPVKAVRKDALRDEYALPNIDGPLEARAKAADPRIATEEELREFIEDLRPEDLDVNSSFFGNLPTEVKYEILGDLRIKTRQVNHRRVQQMRDFGTAVDFSRAQIDNLMERNLYTQRLLDVTDELGRAAIAIPTRVAGQRNREYILVKQDVGKGGGWVLGVKNLEAVSTEPITIDTTTDESVGTHTDTDEFEEVGVESSPEKNAGPPTPDLEARRIFALEAIRARYTAKQAVPAPLDPFLDQPLASPSRSKSSLFAANPPLAGEDDPILQQALYESAQQAADAPVIYHAGPSVYDSASHAPTASTSRAILPPPHPSSRDRGDETDDSMEYVEVPPAKNGKGKEKERAREVLVEENALGTDTEGSDAFEEVEVAAPVAAAAQASLPVPRPSSRRSSPVPSPVSTRPPSLPPPLPAAGTASRSIFDSVLPSDSDSETGASPVRRPRAVPPPQPPPSHCPPAFSRLSTTPDPFEEYETPPQAGKKPPAAIESRDFAFDGRPGASATTLSFNADPDFESTTSPVTSAASNSANSDFAPSSVLPAGFTPVGRISPAPTDVPAPLPPLQKAVESIEAQEAAVLPAVLELTALASQPRSPPTPTSRSKHAAGDRSSAPFQSPENRPLRPTNSPAALRPFLNRTASRGENTSAADVGGAAEQVTQQDKGSEPEEFFSDWSRSPSIPAGRRSSGNALFLPETEYDSEAEAEEAAQALRNEEAAFVDVMAELRNERLENMRAEAERDVAKLTAQKNVEQRNADGVTRHMATDIKEMLILFGIPYIDAPQEAEAECASLLTRNLVDGIVTDDSDVFLFGGSRIYRNMFNESKYVECYLSADLEREIGLDRQKLVRLAHLLGSDYTDGLAGVGPVQGMELLEEFPGDEGLNRFKDWWEMVQTGKDKTATSSKWKKKFRTGHKKLIIDARWPSAEVTAAYFRPTVQESDEAFTWTGIDLDGLRFYLARTLGWDQGKTDSYLLPLLKREQERKDGKLTGQAQLTDFFDTSAGYQPFSRKKQPKFASKRLQNVVQNWKAKAAGPQNKIEELEAEEASVAEEELPAQKGKKKAKAPKAAPKPKKKAAPRKKSTQASRKRDAQTQRDARAAANGGVYSSDEDLRSDCEKEQEEGEGAEGQGRGKGKGRTRTQPARKKRKTAEKRVVESEVEEE